MHDAHRSCDISEAMIEPSLSSLYRHRSVSSRAGKRYTQYRGVIGLRVGRGAVVVARFIVGHNGAAKMGTGRAE